MSMTSRELVINAIEHKEPERVPVDLGSTPSSGISAIAYKNLTKDIGSPEIPKIYDVVQQLAQPSYEFIERFGVDAVDIGRTFNDKEEDWYEVELADGGKGNYPAWFKPQQSEDGSFSEYADGVQIAKMPNKGTFFDQTYFPYLEGYPDDFSDLPEEMGKVLWAAMVHSPWDHAGEEGFWDDLRERTLRLRENSDKALVVVCGCNLFEWGCFLRRMDNFMMDVFSDQGNVERLLDALMEQHLPMLSKVCETVGDIADVLRFGDDLGMDSGPFMSPEIYRKLFKPRHKQLCDYVKKNSQMKTFLHSCGSIYKLIPDLIEAGYDVLNPVQTNAVDMEPVKLKEEFGSEVTFWGGGCDTRYVLNNARPGEVKDHVKERLEIFHKGGGFVFNTVHNILPEVPPENILAMFEAIEEFND